MAMASDEEVLSALKHLESISALESVHLKPHLSHNQLLLQETMAKE